MSVLKAHRSESKAEFVNTANKIYVETINFLSRLSARFSRLMANDVSHLASEVLVNAEKANSIFPSDHTRKELRKQHLLESRAALMALDVELSHCYDIMMLNPEGCFTTSNGNPVKPARAKEILENMEELCLLLWLKEKTWPFPLHFARLALTLQINRGLGLNGSRTYR